MIEVKIVPHVGIEQTDIGPVEVSHNQYIVLAKGDDGENFIQVGYIGKDADRPFCPIAPFVDLPREAQEDIHARLCVLLGEQRPMGILPLPSAVIAQFIEQDEFEDEEQDDEQEEAE